jgi:cell division protein FtsL
MEQVNKMEIKRARRLAILLSSLIVTSLICLIYSIYLNSKLRELDKESIELKKQLEDCHKSTSN